MDYEKYKRTKKEWLFLIFHYLFFTSLLGYLFYREKMAVLFLLPFFFFYEKIDRKKKIEERKKKLSAQFTECLQVMAGALKAGVSLEQAVFRAKIGLRDIYTEEEPIMKELSGIEAGLRMNLSVEALFTDFGKRSGSSDIREFAEVLAVAKRAGGNLVKVMENTVSFIIGKTEMEREIGAVISGKKLEGKTMGFILPALLFYMNFSMPEVTEGLYHNGRGIVIMTLVLIGYLGCLLWFDKLTDIKV